VAQLTEKKKVMKRNNLQEALLVLTVGKGFEDLKDSLELKSKQVIEALAEEFFFVPPPLFISYANKSSIYNWELRIAEVPFLTGKVARLNSSALDKIFKKVQQVLAQNIHLLFGMEEVVGVLERLRQSHPLLVEEVTKRFSLLELKLIFRKLLKEDIPLHPLLVIFEALLEGSYISRNLEYLSEFIREQLGVIICLKYASNQQLRVFSVDTRLERHILRGLKQGEAGSFLELDPEIREKVMEAFAQKNAQNAKPIFMSSPEVRLPLRKLLESRFPQIVILSRREISPKLRLIIEGVVSLEDAETYIASGEEYYRQNKLELAMADYKRALELDPKSASAHYGLRLVYRKMGKLSLAVEELNKALELDPKYALIEKKLLKEIELDNAVVLEEKGENLLK